MTGRDSACAHRTLCRTFYPDERYARPQGTVSGLRPGHPLLRPGRALAHTTGAAGPGISSPIGRSPAPDPPGRATPRSGRPPWNAPPVPGRPASFRRPSQPAPPALSSSTQHGKRPTARPSQRWPGLRDTGRTPTSSGGVGHGRIRIHAADRRARPRRGDAQGGPGRRPDRPVLAAQTTRWRPRAGRPRPAPPRDGGGDPIVRRTRGTAVRLPPCWRHGISAGSSRAPGKLGL
jgi:hypothetical protein